MVRATASLALAALLYGATSEIVLAIGALPIAFFFAAWYLYACIAIIGTAWAIATGADWPYAIECAAAAGMALALLLGRRGSPAVGVQNLPQFQKKVVRSRARVVSIAMILAGTILLVASLFSENVFLPNLGVAISYFWVARAVRREYAVRRVRAKLALMWSVYVLGMLLFVLGVVEIGARALVKGPVVSVQITDLLEHDPDAWWLPAFNRETVGYRARSNSVFVPFDVRLSANGLRGPDLGPKQPDELRVLIAGDSYTFGWGMDEGQDYASELRRQLTTLRGGAPSNVINCGANGFGPWQARVLMEKRGFPLDPDVVILQLYPANDGWNSLAKWGKTLQAYGPKMVEYVAYWRDYDHWVMRAETWLRRRWFAYHVVRTRSTILNDSLPILLSRLRFLPAYHPPQPVAPEPLRPPMIEQCLVDWYPDLQAGWDEMERDVVGIVESCRKRGVPVFVYALPFPVFDRAVWDAYIAQVQAEYGSDLPYKQFLDVRAAEVFLEREGIPWIPILDPLLQKADPDSYFIPNDGHLNEKGAQFVCGLITDRLAQEGLLKREL